MSKDYEVLIFISDQHSGAVCGYAGDPVVRTPNLNRIAAKGAAFLNAYTSCPLCVPARASLMTERYPIDIGVVDNAQSFASHEPTFAHSLGSNDYQTSLCGRMHFNGMDQRHGFDQRIALDITNTFWGGSCTEIAFAKRDVHEIFPLDRDEAYHYDHYVAEEAVKYLEQDHEEKQMIVVGTYMPHCPLGAPQELADYYRDKMKDTPHDITMPYLCDGVLRTRKRFGSDDLEQSYRERAYYYAMIEDEDMLVGKVYDKFHEYCECKGKPGIFIYTSDHGDMMGDKGLYAKRNLFEYASKIPLIIQVDGKEHQEIHTPVSLMDISATICSLTGSPRLPYGEGRDLTKALDGEPLEDIPVISNILGSGRNGEGDSYGTMVRYQNYKFITYKGLEDQELLFDIDKDPKEHVNLISEHPEVVSYLREIAENHNFGSEIKLKKYKETAEGGPDCINNATILSAYGAKRQYLNETWHLMTGTI
ncbi:MAG: hypothetical protein E7233_05290 [Lachnospiraceae bacterium]|nr:hypothetical protein [Lachnospiraceae bacterium]